MNNAEWMIEKGYKFSDVIIKYSDTDERREFIVLIKHEKVDEFSLDLDILHSGQYVFKR